MTGLREILFASVCALAFGVPASQAAEKAPFQMMDVFDLEYADDPQISPNGRRIVYVRRSMDIMKDRVKGNLWIVETDGDNHRPLLADSNSYGSPRWSPDGSRLAYVTAAEGSPQIYVRWMDTGQTAKIADLTRSPGNLSWSPDGETLAFTMSVDAKPQSLATTMPSPPKGANWADAPRVFDRVQYRFNGAGYLPPTHTHVFVVPASGGSPRQITSGDFDHGGTPSWAGNDTLIVSANRNEDADYDVVESELYEVSITDGSMTALTDRDGSDGSPSVSPNGRYIAYTGAEDDGKSFLTTRLYLMDRRSGKSRVLTGDLDRNVGNLQWAGDDTIFFQYDDHGTSKIGSVTVSGKRSVVASGLGGTSMGRPYTSGDYSVAENGAFAATLSDGATPADLAAARSSRADLKVLTDLNSDLTARAHMGAMEKVTFASSHDGKDIEGWYLLPPGFDKDKKYPLILEIHGGPHTAYGANFTAEGQLYAAAGYVVLFVNPRGSTSYGNAFANLIDKNYPSQDYDDLISGVDAMIAKGFVDESELYVTGGSGGGVLTAWIVGKTDRFKAAVVAKPVINWTSFVLTADAYPYFTKYWFTKMPWEDPEQYWERSPLSLVGNVTTPTMVMVGDEDYRTPVSETEQYYQALKLRKIDTAMVRIPGASHGIASRPSQLMAKAAYVLGWFEKYRPKAEGE